MNHIAVYLRRVCFNKLSGQIIFKRGPIQKVLFFENGDLVNAKTNVPEERLGEILFKLGKISDEAHSKIERYIEPGQAIGKSLTKKGLTSQRNVEDGVTYQIREIGLSLFPYFDGEIAFYEKASLIGQDFATRINVPYLIEDGIRRMKPDPALQKYFAKRIAYPSKAGKLQHLLTEEEKEMLSRIEGEGNCETLWRRLKYNPEFFWKTLYLLYCLNMIDLRDEDEALPETQKRVEAPSAEAQEKIEEILKFREKITSMNYYQILHVGKEASEDEIKKAYFQLARKFHPDRFDRSVNDHYRVRIGEVFDAVTKAYRTLSDKALRKEYDAKSPAAAKEDSRDFSRRADVKFRQAKTLYNLGRHEDALILLEEALSLKRDKADYFLLLAMTEAKIPSYHRKAEEHFLKARELEPWNPEAYVGLGLLYKKEGLLAKATKSFQKALELDHDHDLARRELEALGKGAKKRGLKGLFSINIFGPKKK
ncbi:MAG: DnaJ domain-containing protein [Clostridiales bacterium]|nr:DnaJ domain-containing protein [Clostridiales bacterium]